MGRERAGTVKGLLIDIHWWDGLLIGYANMPRLGLWASKQGTLIRLSCPCICVIRVLRKYGKGGVERSQRGERARAREESAMVH